MQKQHGFSIVELLIAMTILGILGAISAPSFQRWQRRDAFISQTREITQTLNSVRTYAFSEKKCPSGDPSHAWHFEILPINDITSFRIACTTQGNLATEDLSAVPFNVHNTLSEIKVFDANSDAVESSFTDLQITFFSGSGNAVIGSTTEQRFSNMEADVTFTQSGTTDQRHLLFNRISGFPTLK